MKLLILCCLGLVALATCEEGPVHAQCVGGVCYPQRVMVPVTQYQPYQMSGMVTRPYIWQGPIATALRGGYRHYSVPVYSPVQLQQQAGPANPTFYRRRCVGGRCYYYR